MLCESYMGASVVPVSILCGVDSSVHCLLSSVSVGSFKCLRICCSIATVHLWGSQAIAGFPKVLLLCFVWWRATSDTVRVCLLLARVFVQRCRDGVDVRSFYSQSQG